MSNENTDDLEKLLETRVPVWKALIAEGRIGEALKDVDGLPADVDSQKPFLRVQLLSLAGLHGQTLEAIESLGLPTNTEPAAALRLARIALDAGGNDEAIAVLEWSAETLPMSQDELEQVVELALATRDRALQDRTSQILHQQFPDSLVPVRLAAKRLGADGAYASAAALLAQRDENRSLVEVYLILDRYLNRPQPDYESARKLIALSPKFSLAAKLFVDHAVRSGALRQALAFVRADVPVEPNRSFLLITILGASLIESSDRRLTDSELRLLVTDLLRYLATNPGEKGKRMQLVRLLSPEIAGTFGLALMADLVFEALTNTTATTPPSKMIRMATDQFLVKHRAFLDGAFSWLKVTAPILLGRTALPNGLLAGDPDELMAGTMSGISLLAPQIGTDAEVQTLLNWLALAATIAPHTSQPNTDMKMMRLVGGALANVGRTQQARDIVESAIDATGTVPDRQALAWSAMADIYHRAGSQLEGLIALACSLATSTQLDMEELWYRLDCTVRLFRDLQLFALARNLHARAGQALRDSGYWASNQHRHELVELQLDTLQYLADPESRRHELEPLVARACVNATEVITRNDHPIAIAVILGQLVRDADNRNLTIDPTVRDTLRTLTDRSGPLAEFVSTVSKKEPTPIDVLRLHQRLETPRFAEDIAFDHRQVVLMARRLLRNGDASAVALAVELLADRAVSDPMGVNKSQALPPLKDESVPAQLAIALSSRFSVVMGAFDEDDVLTWVVAENGTLSSVYRESPSTFSADGFRNWSRQFPYRYGIDRETVNLFYTSTEQLCLSRLPQGPVVFITEPSLQQFPSNLLRSGDSFAGHLSAVSTAPSLGWLVARVTDARLPSNSLRAWIPSEGSSTGTLAMVAERLDSVFGEYGIQVETQTTLPRSMAGVGVAIVVAHGSVDRDEAFFNRLSDDEGAKFDSRQFATAVERTSVVLLFVCSGGRLDRHPTANTAVGLARQLLYQGTSTVIASPWPIDARVPSHWLPAFLRTWQAGLSITDANFEANAVVAARLGNDPAHCLAMTVYGDPLTLFPA